MNRLEKMEIDEAIEAGHHLANKLEDLQEAAIRTNAGQNSDDVQTVNAVIANGLNRAAADELDPLLAEAIEAARMLPLVNDDGRGIEPIHPAALNVLRDRGFQPVFGATGEQLTVKVNANDDGNETLNVELLTQAN